MIVIHDIGLAAFIKIVKKTDYAALPHKEKSSDGKRFVFEFDISDEELNKNRVDYINSEHRKMDQEIRDLKKTLNESSR
jgi:hypothetical protein